MNRKLGGESRRANEKPVIEVIVLRHPGIQDPEWRVAFDGKVTAPSFNSRGAADAYATWLKRGKRQPEFSNDRS